MKTVVLDIETISDALAMERCAYKQDETFAPWPLHELACASVLTVTSRGFDPLGFDLQSFTRGTMGERGIVASVEEAINGASFVVTYNGTAFDLPVLVTRATLAQQPVPNLAKLSERGPMAKHRDLHEDVRRGGSGIKLAHLCAPFGIPVKTGGIPVADLAAAERWDAIANYCETDVVATWIAMQLWNYRGNGGRGYDGWRAIGDWIQATRPENPRLMRFVEALHRELADQRASWLLPFAASQPILV